MPCFRCGPGRWRLCKLSETQQRLSLPRSWQLRKLSKLISQLHSLELVPSGQRKPGLRASAKQRSVYWEAQREPRWSLDSQIVVSLDRWRQTGLWLGVWLRGAALHSTFSKKESHDEGESPFQKTVRVLAPPSRFLTIRYHGRTKQGTVLTTPIYEW